MYYLCNMTETSVNNLREWKIVDVLFSLSTACFFRTSEHSANSLQAWSKHQPTATSTLLSVATRARSQIELNGERGR